MAIVPSEASRQAHKVSGIAWKVFTNLCEHRDLVTGQCNPSHRLIAQETGVEISGVSVAKKELRGLGWIETSGKWSVIIKIGIDEFERVRAAHLAKIQRSEVRIFGKSKDRAGNVGIFGGQSLENPNDIYKDGTKVEQNAAAATTAADRDAWKKETVDQSFLDELVTRGLFSKEVVAQSWRELAFKVAMRPVGSVATKGELMAFCFAKQRTGVLPTMETAQVVDLSSARAEAQASSSGAQVRECPATCPLCFGGQMQVIAGRGARPCPNRAGDDGAGVHAQANDG